MATKLSVRAELVGGGVLDRVKGPSQISATRLTILVHGYNNNQRTAAERYANFIENSGLASNSLLAGEICEFYWPGDRQWGPASGLAYPSELEPARASAWALLRYLRELSAVSPIEVGFICHSLGSRVAVEVLAAHLRSPVWPGLRFDSLCMMAAAVPVRLVDNGGSLRSAIAASSRSLVLYSPKDTVLSIAFPMGETAIPGEGWFPAAVGHGGEPNVWTEPARNLAPYGHGDYWGGNLSSAYVRKFFGIAVENALASASIAPHALPPVNTIESASIGEHRVGGS